MRIYARLLSFRPLLALRIAFREWDTFFFGTARRKGGRSSSNDCRLGIAQLNGFWEARKVGNRAAVIAGLAHDDRRAGNNVLV